MFLFLEMPNGRAPKSILIALMLQLLPAVHLMLLNCAADYLLVAVVAVGGAGVKMVFNFCHGENGGATLILIRTSHSQPLVNFDSIVVKS